MAKTQQEALLVPQKPLRRYLKLQEVAFDLDMTRPAKTKASFLTDSCSLDYWQTVAVVMTSLCGSYTELSSLPWIEATLHPMQQAEVMLSMLQVRDSDNNTK